MSSENEVVLPPKVQERLRAYMAQLQQMQAGVNQYFQGICDSLGLEGEWSLDIARMMAVKQAVPDAPAAKGNDGNG